MIFGDCPYCGHMGAFEVPDNQELPVMVKATCNNCGEWFWERVSRVDPAGFRRDQVVVNEETKTVHLIEEKLTEEQLLAQKVLRELVSEDEMTAAMTDAILYGSHQPTEEDRRNTEKSHEWIDAVLQGVKERPITKYTNIKKTDEKEETDEA